MNLKKLTRRRNFLFLQAITSIVLIVMLVRLGIIPLKYMAIIVLVIAALLGLSYFLLEPFKRRHHDEKKKTKFLVGKIVAVLLSILMVVGSVYAAVGGNTLDDIFGENKETITYSLVVLKDSSYKKLKDLENKTVGIQPNVDTVNQNYVLKQINKTAKVKTDESLNYEAIAKKLLDKNVDAILLNEAYRTAFAEYDKDFSDKTKVIWSYELTQDIKEEKSTNAAGTFNIYLSGIDVYGTAKKVSRSDVNMIATVNTNTHKVMLTSIPRDYYVTLANSGKKDKLTHSGLFGVENTVKTVENLMGIDIDYYARVNFSTLTKLVDEIGGIDIYSDKTLKLLHGSTVHEGMNHLNGADALGFARERYGYTSGDRHRTQNQQTVLIAIMKKILSPKLLTNYMGILSSLDDSLTTNMPTSKMKELVSQQLDTNGSWTFEQQMLDGTGKTMTGGYMMPSRKLYYMIPDEETVENCATAIKNIMSSDSSI